MMKNRLRIKSKLILVLGFTLFLAACLPPVEFEYLGNYPELYSVAINSLLGARGEGPGAMTGPVQPNIIVFEEDNYGRRLFSYDEYSSIGINRVIIQKVEGNYAYFYPHYNFILSSSNSFTDEEIEILKETNSWNQPMNDGSEFLRVRIVRQQEEGPISDEKLIEVHDLIFPDSELNNNQITGNTIFFRRDRYERSIYLRSSVAILFQPDHSFDKGTGMLVIDDLHNYQTELRLFMEANGWDEPWND